MTSEIEAFRAEMRAAGQPWNRRGVWTIAAGVVMLAMVQLIAQAAPVAATFFFTLAAAILLIVLGSVFLVVAILRRRRWAMDHPMVLPALSDTEHGASGNA